jgi:simple sugar transport system ATP-binding protein
VPEERLGRGAVPTMCLAHNLLNTRTNAVRGSVRIQVGALQKHAQSIIERFHV